MIIVYILISNILLCGGYGLEEEVGVKGKHQLIKNLQTEVIIKTFTDKYDYEESVVTNQSESTFVDKWRESYEQGKDVTFNNTSNFQLNDRSKLCLESIRTTDAQRWYSTKTLP